MVGKDADVNVTLKSLTAQDFLYLGLQQVAYVRPVTLDEGKTAFAVHAADGTTLSVLDSLDTAVVTIRHNDLEPITVH